MAIRQPWDTALGTPLKVTIDHERGLLILEHGVQLSNGEVQPLRVLLLPEAVLELLQHIPEIEALKDTLPALTSKPPTLQ